MLHGLKLLLVDDDTFLRSQLATIFTSEGMQVRTAGDGFLALDAICEEMPHILVSNLEMLGMASFEFLSLVRRRLGPVYVIAMTEVLSANPHPVAADGIYQKGSSLQILLDMIEDAERYPPHIPSGQPSKRPVWIHCSGHDVEGPYAIIQCPACQHVFPQSLGEHKRRFARTKCEHCHHTIDYGLLQPDTAGWPQPFQRDFKVGHVA